MNMLRNGIRWLHEQRHASMSDAFTYLRRAGSSSTPLRATRARGDHDELIEQQLIMVGDVADFILRSVDLEVAGEFVDPQPGDRLTDSLSGYVYELCEEGQQRCWRPSDQYGYAVRVHTRRVQ